MHDVVIVGCGGLGREIAEWLEDINADRPAFNALGFLDDDATKHGGIRHDLPILGGLDWLAGRRDVHAVIGVGATPQRARLVNRLRGVAAGFPIVRHPSAIIGRFVTIGEGTLISPAVVATADVAIGAFVTLNYQLTIGHDCRVSDFVTLAPGVNLSGFVQIGEGADLGAGAVVLPGKRVGAWSIVGAGAVVTEDVPDDCTAVGVPARPIKQRSPGWQLS